MEITVFHFRGPFIRARLEHEMRSADAVVATNGLQKWTRCMVAFALVLAAIPAISAPSSNRELIRDPHFQHGFVLLEPKPGQRVAYDRFGFVAGETPVWDLAQWSSRFPLNTTNVFRSERFLVLSNSAKAVMAGQGAAADLSLAVNAGMEYTKARASTREPWVHLLVQQEIQDPPALKDLAALNFHVEARLNRSRLCRTNDYSPSIHAAQFLIYLTVANRNPQSPGYQDCFWFGIPVYDNRERMVSAYAAEDFGDTRLFIFTPGSETFTSRSTHDWHWVSLGRDLLPLLRTALEQARSKGYMKNSSDVADFRPLGIFIGWEVPGVFDVDLQIRNLSLTALAREH